MKAQHWQRFRRAESGSALVEFVVSLPIMLLVFFGGYSATQAVAISRKVTITTRAMADLASQYSTITADEMSTILGASTQVMAPYSATALSLRLSQITVDSKGKSATVSWSKTSGSGYTAYTAGQSVTLTSSMMTANTSYILSEASYSYSPLTKVSSVTFPMSDKMYMFPRLSASITYSS